MYINSAELMLLDPINLPDKNNSTIYSLNKFTQKTLFSNVINIDVNQRDIRYINHNEIELMQLTAKKIIYNSDDFIFLCKYSDQQQAADKLKTIFYSDNLGIFEFKKWFLKNIQNKELYYIPLEHALYYKNIPVAKQLLSLFKQSQNTGINYLIKSLSRVMFINEVNPYGINIEEVSLHCVSMTNIALECGGIELVKELLFFYFNKYTANDLIHIIKKTIDEKKPDIFSCVLNLFIKQKKYVGYTSFLHQAIIYAINNNLCQDIETLLEHGMHPNEGDCHDNIVNCAITKKNIDILQLLYKYGANFNCSHIYKDAINGKCYTLSNLEYAIKYSNLATISYLIHKGATTPKYTIGACRPSSTPLHIAIEQNNPIIVALLLSTKVSKRTDKIYKNNCTLTALKYAKQLNTSSNCNDLIISILKPVPSLSVLSIEKLILDFLETGRLDLDTKGNIILLNLLFPNNLQPYINYLQCKT